MTKRIVIVGGGTGGTVTANLLARSLYHQLINGSVIINMIAEKEDTVVVSLQNNKLDAR